MWPARGTQQAHGSVNIQCMNQWRKEQMTQDSYPVLASVNLCSLHMARPPSPPTVNFSAVSTPLGHPGMPHLWQGELGLSFQISCLCSADVKFMSWNSKKENDGILFHWLFKMCCVPKGWIYKHYWKFGNGCQEFLSFVSAWARVWLLLLQIMG